MAEKPITDTQAYILARMAEKWSLRSIGGLEPKAWIFHTEHNEYVSRTVWVQSLWILDHNGWIEVDREKYPITYWRLTEAGKKRIKDHQARAKAIYEKRMGESGTGRRRNNGKQSKEKGRGISGGRHGSPGGKD